MTGTITIRPGVQSCTLTDRNMDMDDLTDIIADAASGECGCDTEDVLADLYQPSADVPYIVPACDDDERIIAAYYQRRPVIAEQERAWEYGADLGNPVG